MAEELIAPQSGIVLKVATRAPSSSSSALDPVEDLPEDIAALWLSFADVYTLLGTLQHVSRAWRSAIVGDQPAVYHMWCQTVLSLKPGAYDHCGVCALRLQDLAKQSQGGIRIIKKFVPTSMHLQPENLSFMPSFRDLRSLKITLNRPLAQRFSELLSSFNLLEDLSVEGVHRDEVISFPQMSHLKSVRCVFLEQVAGIRNLSALRKLYADAVIMVESGGWPASLREVTLTKCHPSNNDLLGGIASLPQPTKICTDWSFVEPSPRVVSIITPPYDQLSFLPHFSTLEHLTSSFSQRFPRETILNYLGYMTSLRELVLHVSEHSRYYYGNASRVCDEQLQGLAMLTNLRALTLGGMTGITHNVLSYLSDLPQLTRLSLHYCCNFDYSLVATRTHLRSLEIKYVSTEDALDDRTIKAIASMPHLEELVMYDVVHADPASFRHYCSMRSLRKLVVSAPTSHDAPFKSSFPAASFAGLPALCLLDTICVDPVADQDVRQFVDCLVQMPMLRHVDTSPRFSDEDQMRLRSALPRLQECSGYRIY